jgi:hypothetical protein
MEPSQVLDRVLEESRPVRTITRGTALEGIVGLGAAVLAILGLAGGYVETLLPVSTIVLGIAMIIEGRVIIGRFSHIMRELGELQGYRSTAGGMSIEVLAGIAGVTLGILSLLGLNPVMLCSAAVIVFGTAVLFSISTIAMINSIIASGHSRNPLVQGVAASMSAMSSDVRVLVGMGTLTLGILSAVGVHQQALALIGILAVGGALFLETFAFGEKLTALFKDTHS